MYKISGAIIQDEDEYLRNQQYQQQHQNLPRIGKKYALNKQDQFMLNTGFFEM